MVFRPITVRKFLYNDPFFTDVLSWNLEGDRYNESTSVSLDFSIGDGSDRRYNISLYRDDSTKKSVSAQLAPINELIDNLSKAAMAYAKACNMPEVKVTEVKKEAKPSKKAKSEAAKK